ncbi:mechanosensitive ion channel domain-containing protein [Microseira sp. BLCC-F43]|jgi:small-conductance mechanosensitive channel/CRP-like cAMP-binding protein|uniref:mechanosensitive ion channel domain-containing protein n=1 Tax=Microseira sp. BLCC-F43 TaxID=3153602 RepID=UPI0035B87ADD
MSLLIGTYAMNQSTLIWGIILILGLPSLNVVLGEGIEYLQRQGNPLAWFLNNIRGLIFPPLAVLLVMRHLLGFSATNISVQIVETALWTATIYTAISLLNAVMTTGIRQRYWQIHVPNLLFQSARALVILGIAAYVLAHIWQVNLSSVFAALGVGSLVMALALQDTLSNLVSGFLLIFESPLKVGDWVKINAHEGEVIEINWRAVRIKTSDRDIVIIPNGVLGKDIIYNYTMLDPLHADRFYISFCREDSPNRIQKVLQNAALGIKGILSDPPPDIRIVSFEGYANKYEVMYYVDNYKKLESIRSDFLTRIHYATKRNHLNIAVPTQREFQLDKEPDMGNSQLQILESLLSLSYFNILARATLDQLAQTATIETYGVDEQIVLAGEFDAAFYIIIAGGVLLSVTDINHQEQEVVRLATGDFFGEMLLLQSEPSPVSVTVVDELKAIAIAPDAILDLAQRNPRFALEMNQFIDSRKKVDRQAKGTHSQDAKSYSSSLSHLQPSN